MKFNSLSHWLSFLEDHSQSQIFNPEDRFVHARELADKLNLLDYSYPPIITVGGTNGKGSCVALLEAIYLTAGYRVGSCTSPHLLSFNERIRIDGKPVIDELIVQAFERIYSIEGDAYLNYFCYATLAALQIFQALSLDIIILEVGIGGRFDVANLLNADLAIITNIELDHCNYLGNTREQIAIEKAGIIRDDQIVICGDESSPNTLLRAVKKHKAIYYQIGKDFNFLLSDQRWCWQFQSTDLKKLPIPMVLLSNAATVLMAITVLQNQLPVSLKQIQDGLQKVYLPGRQQLIETDHVDVLLDVAHNPAAIKSLITKLKFVNAYHHKYLVIGLMKDKEVEEIIDLLIPHIDGWYLTQLPSPRSMDANRLASILKQADVPHVEVFQAPENAFVAVKKRASERDLIVICGSFLNVANVFPLISGKINSYS